MPYRKSYTNRSTRTQPKYKRRTNSRQSRPRQTFPKQSYSDQMKQQAQIIRPFLEQFKEQLTQRQKAIQSLNNQTIDTTIATLEYFNNLKKEMDENPSVTHEVPQLPQHLQNPTKPHSK